MTVGPTTGERKAKAEELAAEFGYVIIPPYDDRDIIAGQGSCGLEIVADRPTVDLVLAPVGGRRIAERRRGCSKVEPARRAGDRS